MKKLKNLLLLLIPMLICGTVYSQEKKAAYKVPSEYAALLLVNDSDGPIQLGDPQFIWYESGGTLKAYSLRNSSNKNIKSFVVKYLSWLSNEESTGYPEVKEPDFFSPGEIISKLPGENEVNFVEFNENLVKDFPFTGHPRNIFVIMVVKVTFSDGTVYDAQDKYKTIQKFISGLKINSRMSASDLESKERELRKYIENTMLRKSDM